jgi:hypothetical protein
MGGAGTAGAAAAPGAEVLRELPGAGSRLALSGTGAGSLDLHAGSTGTSADNASAAMEEREDGATLTSITC